MVRRQAGFTLIEMLVVVAVLGLSLGLLITHGPMHSQALELQAAVNEVAQAARLARSAAIARNKPARFVVDVTQRSFRIDSGAPTVLPGSISMSITTASDEVLGSQVATIRFNGDGSASGGQIELAGGEQRARIGVDWLTGRVTVTRPIERLPGSRPR